MEKNNSITRNFYSINKRKKKFKTIINKSFSLLLTALLSLGIFTVNINNQTVTIKADNTTPVNPSGTNGTVPAEENYSSTINTHIKDGGYTAQYGPGYGPFSGMNVLQSTNTASATAFAAGLPLGTIFIDQSKVQYHLGKIEPTSKNTQILAGLVWDETSGKMGYDGTKTGATKLVPNKINELKGELFKITFEDAAVLPDGTLADLVINYSNARIVIDQRYLSAPTNDQYLHGAMYFARGMAFHSSTDDATDFTSVAYATAAQNRVNSYIYNKYSQTFANSNQKYPQVGSTVDATYTIINKNNTPAEGTFVFAIAGINLDRDPDKISENNASKALWYSYEQNFGGSDGREYSFFSEAVSINGGLASQNIYVRPNTTMHDNPAANITDPKGQYFYPHIKKETKVIDGVPTDTIKFISNSRIAPKPSGSGTTEWGGHDASYSGGFVVLADASRGFKATGTTHGGGTSIGSSMNTPAFNSMQIWYRYISGSGKHGKIEITSEGNPGGNLSVGTILPGGDNRYAEDATGNEKPNTYVVAEGKTVTYTMTPDVGYKAKKIQIRVGSQLKEIKFNEQVISTMKKGDSITIDTNDASIWANPPETTEEQADPVKGKGVLTYEGNGIYTFKFNHAKANEEIYVEWEPTTADILTYKIWSDDNDKDGIRGKAEQDGTLPKFKLQWSKNGRDFYDVTNQMDIGLRNSDGTVKYYELKTPVTEQTVPSGNDGAGTYLDGTYVIDNNNKLPVPDKWMYKGAEYSTQQEVEAARNAVAQVEIDEQTVSSVKKYIYKNKIYDTYEEAFAVFAQANPITRIPGYDAHPFTWEYLPVYTYDRNGRADRAIQYRLVEIDETGVIGDPWQWEYETPKYFEHQIFDLTSPVSNSIEGWGLFTDYTNTYARKGDSAFDDGLYYLVDTTTGIVSSTPAADQPDPDTLVGVSSSDYWTEDHAVPYHEIEAKNKHYTSDIYVDVVKFWNDEIMKIDPEDPAEEGTQYTREDINIILHGEIEGDNPGTYKPVPLNPKDPSTDDLTKTITVSENQEKDKVTGDVIVDGYTVYKDSNDHKYVYLENQLTYESNPAVPQPTNVTQTTEYVGGYEVYEDEDGFKYVYKEGLYHLVIVSSDYYNVTGTTIDNYSIDYTYPAVPQPTDVEKLKKGDGTYKINDDRFGAMFEDLPTHYNGKHIIYTVKETKTDGTLLDEWILTGGQLVEVKENDKLLGYETTMTNTPDVEVNYTPVPLTIYKVDKNSDTPLEGAEFTIYTDPSIGEQGEASESENLVVGKTIYNKTKYYVKQKDSYNRDMYFEVIDNVISNVIADPQPNESELVDTGEQVRGKTKYKSDINYIIQTNVISEDDYDALSVDEKKVYSLRYTNGENIISNGEYDSLSPIGKDKYIKVYVNNNDDTVIISEEAYKELDDEVKANYTLAYQSIIDSTIISESDYNNLSDISQNDYRKEYVDSKYYVLNNGVPETTPADPQPSSADLVDNGIHDTKDAYTDGTNIYVLNENDNQYYLVDNEGNIASSAANPQPDQYIIRRAKDLNTGKVIEKKVTTDASGYATITFLVPNDDERQLYYYLKETKSPEGYYPDPETYAFRIDADLKKITLESPNNEHTKPWWQKLYDLIFGSTPIDYPNWAPSDDYRGGTLKVEDTPIVADILVRKYWNDNNDQDGKRPGDKNNPTSTLDEDLPTVKLQYTLKVHTAEGYSVYTDGTTKYIHKPTDDKYYLVETEDVIGKYETSAAKPQPTNTTLITDETCNGLRIYKDNNDEDKKYVIIDYIYYEVKSIDVEGKIATNPADEQPNPNLLSLFDVDENDWIDADVPAEYKNTPVSYVGGPVLTHQNDAYTWTNIPAYREGKVVTYRILERGDILNKGSVKYAYDIESNHTSQTHEKTFNLVNNSSTNPTGLNQTVDITNKHEPQIINIDVYKRWDDDDKNDRSTTVLHLYKVVNGIEYPVTIGSGTAAHEDTGIVPVEPLEGVPVKSWKDLPTYEGGEPVTYRLKEETVDGYITVYEATYTNKNHNEITETTNDIIAENVERTYYKKGDAIPVGKNVGDENTKAKYEILNERSVNVKVEKTWINGANANVEFELWRTTTPSDMDTPVDASDSYIYYVHKIIIKTFEEYEQLSNIEKPNYKPKYVKNTETEIITEKDIITIEQWNKLENTAQTAYTKKYFNNTVPDDIISVSEFNNLSSRGKDSYTLTTNPDMYISADGNDLIDIDRYYELDPTVRVNYSRAYQDNYDNTKYINQAAYNALTNRGQDEYTAWYVNNTVDSDIITVDDWNDLENPQQAEYSLKYVDDRQIIISKDTYETLSQEDKDKYDVEKITSWSPYPDGGKDPKNYTDGTNTITKAQYDALDDEEKSNYKPVTNNNWELVGSYTFDANSFVNPSDTGDVQTYTFDKDLEIKDADGNKYTYRVLEKPSLLRYRENQISDTKIINNNTNVSDGNVSLEVVKEVENRKWLDDDQFYFYLEPVKGLDVTIETAPVDIAKDKVPMPYRINPATTDQTFNFTADAIKNDPQVGAIGRAATFQDIQYKEISTLYHSIGRGDVVEFYYRVYEVYNTKTDVVDKTTTITAGKTLDEITNHSGYKDGITYAGTISNLTRAEYNALGNTGKDSYIQTNAYINSENRIISVNAYNDLSDEDKAKYEATTGYVNINNASNLITASAYNTLPLVSKSAYQSQQGYIDKNGKAINEREYEQLSQEDKDTCSKSTIYSAFIPEVNEAKVIVKNIDGIITTETQWLKDGEYKTGFVPVFTNTYSSQGYAKAWIEKRISNRQWVEFDNDENTGDAFSYKIESISGSQLNVPGSTSSDSYTSKPLMSNARNNPQSDIQKLSNNEYAFGLRGNKYDNTLLNAEGEAYFIYEISENSAVTYTDDNFNISNYTVDGLEYDKSKIYARLKAKDNWDGTISFEVDYFSDASCKHQITNHKAWIYDDDTETEAGKRLLTMTEAETAKGMTPKQREDAHYREIYVAYFTNYESIDIPVMKQWVDGPAVEDVNLHLFVHKFDLSTITEQEITEEYIKSHENEEGFWQAVGRTHMSKRGEFLNNDGTPKYDEGSDNTSSRLYVDIDGFNMNLPKYEHVADNNQETTYLLVYRLKEDDTSNTYTTTYKSIRNNVITDEQYNALSRKEKDKYSKKYVNNDNNDDIITDEDFDQLSLIGKNSYTLIYINNNVDTDILSESEYDVLSDVGKDSYDEVPAYMHNVTEEVISVEQWNALTPEEQANYNAITSYMNKNDPSDVIVYQEDYDRLDNISKYSYTGKYQNNIDATNIIEKDAYDDLTKKGQNNYSKKYVGQIDSQKQDYIYTDGDTLVVVNTVVAKNVAKPAAVKQLLNRNWLESDDFKFILNPVGKATYDEKGNIVKDDKGNVVYDSETGTDIPMPIGKYVNINNYQIINKETYSQLSDEVKKNYTAVVSGYYVNSEDRSIIIDQDTYDSDSYTEDEKYVFKKEVVYVNNSSLIDSDAYNELTPLGKDSYNSQESGYYVNKKDGTIINEETYEGYDDEEKAKYEQATVYINKNDSTDIITESAYNKLSDYNKDSYKKISVASDEAHADIGETIVDPEGNLERLARFGEISFKTSDLVYNDSDKHYHGDFFYVMIEDIPDGVYAVDKKTLETIYVGEDKDTIPLSDDVREQYYWKDDDTGIIYDGSIYTVHIKVEENRTNELQVQVSYDEKEQGNIKTGTQFTPVYTNRYDTSLIIAQEVDKWIMGRNWKIGDNFDFRMTSMSGAPFVDGDPNQFPNQGTQSDVGREEELEGGHAIHSARGAHVKRMIVTSSTVSNEIQKLMMPKLKFELSDLHKVVETANTLKYKDGTYVPVGMAYDQFIYSFEETNDYLNQSGKAVTDLIMDGDTEYIRITIIDTGNGTLDYYTEVFEDRYCTVPRTIPGTTTPAINPTFVNQLKRDLSITKAWTSTATSDITLRLQWSVNAGDNWYDVDDAEWLPSYVRTTQTIKKDASGTDLTKRWSDLPAYANIEDGTDQRSDDKALNDLWVYYRIVEDDVDHVVTRYSYEPYTPGDEYTNTDKYKTKEEAGSPHTGPEGKTVTYNQVTPAEGENPQANGWYEKINEKYVLTGDTENKGKDYYKKVETYITDRRTQLYVTNWPVDVNGQANVGVVKQYIGKDWEDESFTFVIDPVSSMIGSETEPVEEGEDRTIVIYKDSDNHTISQVQYNALPDKGKDSYNAETVYVNNDTHVEISEEAYEALEDPDKESKYTPKTVYRNKSVDTDVIEQDAYNKLANISKTSYTAENTYEKNVMPKYSKNTAVTDSSTVVSVNEHPANFSPLTIKLSDLAIDTREKIFNEETEKEEANPNYGKAVGTFYYKVYEQIPAKAVDTTEKCGKDVDGNDVYYKVADDANGNKIKYTTEEHLVKIVAVDDGNGNIDTTVSFDDREHGEYVPVYTNYAMMPTPIQGQKQWIGGELADHQNGTVEIEDGKIVDSYDFLGLTLNRTTTSGNAEVLSKDDAGRDIRVVWVRELPAQDEIHTGRYIHDETGEEISYDAFIAITDDEERSHYDEIVIPAQPARIVEQTGEGPDATGTGNSGPYYYTIKVLANVFAYESVTPEENDNPKDKGWYEFIDEVYVLSKDKKVVEGKQYFNKNIVPGVFTYEDPFLDMSDQTGNTYEYYIEEKETKVPEGYGESYDMFDGRKMKVKNTNETTDDITVTKTWDDESDAEGLRPKEVIFHLYKQSTLETDPVQVEVNAKKLEKPEGSTVDKWSEVTWEDLPIYDKEGNKIEYIVIEESIPGYITTYTTNPQDADYTDKDNKIILDGEDGAQVVDVKNSLTPAVTEVKASKVWDDNDNVDNKRCDVVFTLYERVWDESANAYGAETVAKYANGQAVPTITLNGEADETTSEVKELAPESFNKWNAIFGGLPATKSGKTVIYYVQETTTPGNGYKDPVVTGNQLDGYIVTNSREQDTTSASITKVWSDYNNKLNVRPDTLTMQLWRTYVDEKDVTQYKQVTKDINDYDIKVLMSEDDSTDANTWKLEKNEYSKLPKNIVVDVTTVNYEEVDKSQIVNPYAEGLYELVEGEYELSEDTQVVSDETYYKEVLVTKKESRPYTYYWKEVIPNGYTATVNPTTDPAPDEMVAQNIKKAANNATITNTLKVGQVIVTKNWDDKNDEDGSRNAAIDKYKENLKLYAKGADETMLVDGITPVWSSDTNKTIATYSNLPIYDGDVSIVYSIDEGIIGNYTIVSATTSSIDIETNKAEIRITNKHTPGTTSLEFTKVWIDENGNTIRPSTKDYKDWVSLYRKINGGEFVDVTETYANKLTVEDIGDNKYKVQWIDLPVSDDDMNKYTYVARETIESGSYYEAQLGENTYRPSETQDVTTGDIAGGATISNKQVYQDITVRKVWIDTIYDAATNTDIVYALRPSSISLTLTGDDSNVEGYTKTNDAVPTSSRDPLDYTFEKMPVYKLDGITKMTYALSEGEIPNYDTEIKLIDGVLNVINTYRISKFTGSKIWIDGGLTHDNETEVTPKLHLYQLTKNAQGVYVDLQEISLSNIHTLFAEVHVDWNGNDFIIFNLPVGDASGNTYEYYVEEGQIDGYLAPKYSGNVVNTPVVIGEETIERNGIASGGKITNKIKNDVVEITGEKIWLDPVDDPEVVITHNNPSDVTLEVHQVGSDDKIIASEKYEIAWDNITSDSKYTITSVDDGLPRYDDEGKEYTYYVIETSTDQQYDTSYSGSDPYKAYNDETITNRNKTLDDKIDVEVTKVWENDEAVAEETRKPVTITLYKTIDGARRKVGSKTIEVDKEKTEQIITWENQDKYDVDNTRQLIEYTIDETVTIDGYTSEISDIDKETTSGVYKYTVTNKYDNGKTYLVVNKVWDDENNIDGIRPDSITVKLFRNIEGGQSEEVENVTLTLSPDNNWKDAFKDLDIRDENGNTYIYTVDEEGVDEDEYIKKIDDNFTVNKTATITNIHTPNKVQIVAEKKWDDKGKESYRDDVVLHLYGKDSSGGIVYDAGAKTIAKDSSDNKVTWSDLPERHYENNELTWEIIEEAIYGYTPKYEYNKDTRTFTVTNEFTGPTTDITARKVWDDDDNKDGKRPESVTFQLIKKIEDDEEEIDKQVITEAYNWEYTWENLDVVAEVKDGEETKQRYTSVDVPETTVYVYKNDDSIELTQEDYEQKINDGEILEEDYEQKVIPAHTEEKLEEYTEDIMKEVPVLYLVKEVYEESADDPLYRNGYRKPVVSVVDFGVFEIINSREADMTEVSVTKVWNDEDDADGIRPDHIEVTLTQENGDMKPITVIITEKDGKWSYVFAQLPKNKRNDEPYVYKISETEVEGYTTVIDEVNEETHEWLITNTHIPNDPITVEATKVWAEDKTYEHLRKDVTFILMEKVGHDEHEVPDAKACTIPVNDPDKVCRWEDLDHTEDGKTVLYTVREQNVPEGYVSTVTTSQEGHIVSAVVTNTFVEADKATPVTYLDPMGLGGKMIMKSTRYDTVEHAQQAANSKTDAPVDPEHTNLKFAGWDVNYDSNAGFIMVAKYEKDTLVTYIDPLTGKSIVKSEYTDDIDSIDDPSDPSHSGYTFTGWKDIVDEDGNHMRIATFKCNCSSPSPGPNPCPINPGQYVPPRTGVVDYLIDFINNIVD